MVGLLAGLVAGFAVWLLVRQAAGLAVPPEVVGLVAGLGAGLVAWLGAGIVAGISQPGTDDTSPLSPLSSWRSDQAFGRWVGFVVWLGVGLVGIVAGLGAWLGAGCPVPNKSARSTPSVLSGVA